MNALKKLVDRCNEMDMTEQDQWLGDVFMPSLALAELARLQAIEVAAPQAVKALWLAINSDKDSRRRGVYKAAIDALTPRPGVIGDEKG
jgi:hypothetical protein